MNLLKPKILLTPGDPNGIGPEIILKIFSDKSFTDKYELYAAGSIELYKYYSALLDINNLPEDKIIPTAGKFNIQPGKIDKLAGRFSGNAVRMAIEKCVKKDFHAMVTLPISKESFNLGGYAYPGHTEMLGVLTGCNDYAMILYSKELAVSPITGHIPIKEVAGKIKENLILKKILILNNSLVTDFGIKNPKIAVLGLNPHAGDGGLLGEEENKIIKKGIQHLNKAGFNVSGPFPSDGYFAMKDYKNFDLTAAMYHDQGLIPFKMLAFKDGVNFTAGLNIVRTSPDHGTAFNIAGKGKADITSTREAIILANNLSLNRRLVS